MHKILSQQFPNPKSVTQHGNNIFPPLLVLVINLAIASWGSHVQLIGCYWLLKHPMGLWLVGSELTNSDLRAMVAHEVSLDSTSLIQVIHTFSPQKKRKEKKRLFILLGNWWNFQIHRGINGDLNA